MRAREGREIDCGVEPQLVTGGPALEATLVGANLCTKLDVIHLARTGGVHTGKTVKVGITELASAGDGDGRLPEGVTLNTP